MGLGGIICSWFPPEALLPVLLFCMPQCLLSALSHKSGALELATPLCLPSGQKKQIFFPQNLGQRNQYIGHVCLRLKWFSDGDDVCLSHKKVACEAKTSLGKLPGKRVKLKWQGGMRPRKLTQACGRFALVKPLQSVLVGPMKKHQGHRSWKHEWPRSL